jgi:hypothetical protein
MRHRTALITAGSIAAVVFAGAIAVGVNLGILTVADSTPAGVGQLTASAVVKTGAAGRAPSFVAAKGSDAGRTGEAQVYIIKKAGRVKVAFSKRSVRLVDVTAKPHWTWKLAQSVDGKLTVAFVRGSQKYTFAAALDRHGKLTARVDHPVTKVSPAATSASASTWAVATVAKAPSAGHGNEGGGSNRGGGADD